jgi:hypothetical protein
LEVIYESWSKPILGSPSYVWEEKLHVVKVALKEWAKGSYISHDQERLVLQRPTWSPSKQNGGRGSQKQNLLEEK